MSKYLKILGQGVKYSLYIGGATLTGSLIYLQYISYRIGGIDLDRATIVKYYSDNSKQFRMSESEAGNMYYWLFLDIAMMRVFTYNSYTTSCSKLNRRIVEYTLKNYEERGIIKQIDAVNAKPNPAQERKIFQEILAIRKSNF